MPYAHGPNPKDYTIKVVEYQDSFRIHESGALVFFAKMAYNLEAVSQFVDSDNRFKITDQTAWDKACAELELSTEFVADEEIQVDGLSLRLLDSRPIKDMGLPLAGYDDYGLCYDVLNAYHVIIAMGPNGLKSVVNSRYSKADWYK